MYEAGDKVPQDSIHVVGTLIPSKARTWSSGTIADQTPLVVGTAPGPSAMSPACTKAS